MIMSNEREELNKKKAEQKKSNTMKNLAKVGTLAVAIAGVFLGLKKGNE